MAWIELHQAVWTHRKTFELAGILDLDETYAAAHMIRLWTWALDNAPDGDLSGLSVRAIAFGAGWRGNADEFVSAVQASGWLDEDRCIHDWQQYAGRLIDRRNANAERMRSARANRVDSTNTPRAAHVQRTTNACPGATGPDHTGPNLTGENHVPTERSAAEQLLDELGADAPAKTKSRAKSEKTLPPEDFEPNEADYAAGKALGMETFEVDSKAVACMDFWRGKGEKRPDWHATLRTWLRNAPRFDQPRNGAPHRNGSSRPPPNGVASRIPTDASEFLMGRNGPIPRR